MEKDKEHTTDYSKLMKEFNEILRQKLAEAELYHWFSMGDEYIEAMKIEVEKDMMNFSQALERLKEGESVYRKGWNGKGMFAYLVPGGEYATQTKAAKEHFGEKVNYNPYLALKTVDNTISLWSPSNMDILAEDYCLL